jgi:hypothetical protein
MARSREHESSKLLGISPEILMNLIGASQALLVHDKQTNNILAAAGVCIDDTGIILTVDILFAMTSLDISLFLIIDNQRVPVEAEIERYGDELNLAIVKVKGVEGMARVKLLEREIGSASEEAVIVYEDIDEESRTVSRMIPARIAKPTAYERYDDEFYAVHSEDIYIVYLEGDNRELLGEGASGAGIFTKTGELVGMIMAIDAATLDEEESGITRAVAIRNTRIIDVFRKGK